MAHDGLQFEPAVHPVLSEGEVHVWRASLQRPLADIRSLVRMLSRDELGRAERWRFEQDRDRFIVGRALLRAILGRYVGVNPNRLQFRSGPNGKPALTQQSGGDRFHFNMSHSQGLVLYAVTHHQEIGVDVERVRSIPEADQIAARFFSPREYAEFRAVPTKLKCDAFLNCWTRKQAFVKATGDGLAWPLDRFEVSLTPGQPAQLVSVSGDATEASRWSLKTLIPAPGYTAALAVRAVGCRLICWQWPSREPQEEDNGILIVPGCAGGSGEHRLEEVVQ